MGWSGEVAVVEDQHVRQSADRPFQVGERARKAAFQFVCRHVVAALRDAHRHPLGRAPGRRETNEAEHDGVAAVGSSLKEAELVTDRIGEDGLKRKTLVLTD